MIHIKNLLIFGSVFFFFLSCSPEKKPDKVLTMEQAQKSLIDANKARLKVENSKIEAYIKRRKWNMNQSGSGLRYMIYEKGGGDQVDSGKTAIINYSMQLIDGTNCYSSEKYGTKGFTAGNGEVENGLDEGVFYLRVGDKAKFILPSHLGFGLMGDGNKIPSHSVLIYDVELLDIK